jgi:hypothetical protein
MDPKELQETLDRERRKMELEKERAVLQSDIVRQRAEAERDLLRTLLEQERLRTTTTLEQLKLQGELSAKIHSPAAAKNPESKKGSDAKTGYVPEFVSYHALKRVSSDITRNLSTVVGLGNDARIMIVDGLDYATGDIPFIEVTSQLSVFEIRCRKQVAANKDLTDLVMQKDEGEGEEKTPAPKTGTTRLAALDASSFLSPSFTTAATAPPGISDVAGTAADIAGYARPDSFSGNRNIPLKTAALIAAVAGSLRSEKRYVYICDFYSMETTGPQSRLMNMYTGVLDCGSRLVQSRNRLQYFISKKAGMLAGLMASLQSLGDEKDRTGREPEAAILEEEITSVTAWLDRANMEVLASDAIQTELRTYIKNIALADAARPASKLAQAVLREKVHELGITHLLYLGILSSGGEAVTRKWLLGSGSTSYLGGAVAGYVLARAEGDVLSSDILPILYSFGYDPADQRHSPLKQIRFEKQEPKK